MADTPWLFTIESDLRPAYYDDFHCLAADCRLSCCVGWRISFSKRDYLSLKREKGSPELTERLQKGVRRIRGGDREGPFYAEFLMEDGICPLLGEDSLCRLQCEKGHDALPNVCKTFPRSEIKPCSGYLERSLSPACEGVLALLWDLPDGIEFRSDELDKKERRIIPHPNPLQPLFQDIRSLCIDILQDRRFLLLDRILLMGLILRDIPGDEAEVPTWLAHGQAVHANTQRLDLVNDDLKQTSFPLFYRITSLSSQGSTAQMRTSRP